MRASILAFSRTHFSPGDRSMNAKYPLAAGLLAAALFVVALQVRAQEDKSAAKLATPEKPTEAAPPADSTTQGTVTARGQAIAYTAVAGTLTVGATDDQDGQLGMDGKPLPGSQLALNPPKEPGDTPPVARMFYVAYFK